MGKLVAIDSGNFKQEVLDSPAPVLVDFWAEWCRPCLMLAPVLEKVAEKYAGKLKMTKLNVDQGQQVSADHQVMSIPSLVIFNQGKEIGRMVGFMDAKTMALKIDEILEKAKG